MKRFQIQNDEYFTVFSSTPTPRPRTSSSSSKDTIIASRRHTINNPNLQVVTQALHIPPQTDGSNEAIEEINEASANEVERLKRDMRQREEGIQRDKNKTKDNKSETKRQDTRDKKMK